MIPHGVSPHDNIRSLVVEHDCFIGMRPVAILALDTWLVPRTGFRSKKKYQKIVPKISQKHLEKSVTEGPHCLQPKAAALRRS